METIQDVDITKLDLNFVAHEWLRCCQSRHNYFNLDVTRVTKCYVELLGAHINDPADWKLLLDPNRSELRRRAIKTIKSLYWGHKQPYLVEEFRVWLRKYNQSNGKKFSALTESEYRTQINSRFNEYDNFASVKCKPVTAALMVKLNEALEHPNTLDPSIEKEASNVLQGPNKRTWENRIILPTELRQFFPKADSVMYSTCQNQSVSSQMKSLNEQVTEALESVLEKYKELDNLNSLLQNQMGAMQSNIFLKNLQQALQTFFSSNQNVEAMHRFGEQVFANLFQTSLIVENIIPTALASPDTTTVSDPSKCETADDRPANTKPTQNLSYNGRQDCAVMSNWAAFPVGDKSAQIKNPCFDDSAISGVANFCINYDNRHYPIGTTCQGNSHGNFVREDSMNPNRVDALNWNGTYSQPLAENPIENDEFLAIEKYISSLTNFDAQKNRQVGYNTQQVATSQSDNMETSTSKRKAESLETSNTKQQRITNF